MRADEMELRKKYRLPDGEVVEFSRFGSTGLVIVHAPGEPDMQSCWLVQPNVLVTEIIEE